MEHVIALTDILVWPLAVVIAMFLFKRQIRGLLKRLRRAGIGKNVLEFGEAEIDRGYAEPPKLPEPASPTEANAEGFKSDKPATLFWLGNDLMWIQDMMYRAAPPGRVLQGVQHARQYAEDLGFDETSFPGKQLALAVTILESLRGITEFSEDERRLLQQHYGTVDQYIKTVKWYVHALLKQQQPDFEKHRAI